MVRKPFYPPPGKLYFFFSWDIKIFTPFAPILTFNYSPVAFLSPINFNFALCLSSVFLYLLKFPFFIFPLQMTSSDIFFSGKKGMFSCIIVLA
jgi:hypothetical protein